MAFQHQKGYVWVSNTVKPFWEKSCHNIVRFNIRKGRKREREGRREERRGEREGERNF